MKSNFSTKVENFLANCLRISVHEVSLCNKMVKIPITPVKNLNQMRVSGILKSVVISTDEDY